MMSKQELEVVDNSQTTVLTHEPIQYGTYFDHGYGNVTIDTSQLSTVDLQLLLDTSATATATENPTHILTGNVDHVTQLTTHETDTPQNITDKILQLNILTESEAAQFAAQLTQHGVIVRSAEVAHEQAQEPHLIVGATNIDGHTSQLLVSERQAAQLLANAQLAENHTLTLDATNQNDMLQETGVLQFNNNRTAVIQIQHNDNIITTQQVLLTDQHITNDLHVTSGLEAINTESVQITELQRSNGDNTTKLECDSEVQQYIEEEQIVSNLPEVGNLSEDNVEHTYQNMSI